MTLTKPKAPRAPVNHHKRRGSHHKHSQHYLKSYWPYLPVFAILGMGLVANSWLGRTHHDVLGYSTNVTAQTLLAQTNGERVDHHEPALELSTQLTAAAQAKANDMARRNYWSHITPDGKQPWSFVEASGYEYQAAGENLAYGFGSSDQIMTAWMNSPEHRANILNTGYQDVGFATANVASYQGHGPQTVIVAIYGQPTGYNMETAAPVVLGTQTSAVTRLSLLTTATWLPVALAALCGAALTYFVMRHALAWHKVLVRGEEFFVKHPFLDVILMSAVVVALVVAHTAGNIL